MRILFTLLAMLALALPAGAAPHPAHKYPQGKATADRGCLQPQAKALLAAIEAKWGKVNVISTCRPGAVIKGTKKPSLHRYGRAIDFRAKNQAAIVKWLRSACTCGVITYGKSGHVHVDVGRGKYYAHKR